MRNCFCCSPLVWTWNLWISATKSMIFSLCDSLVSSRGSSSLRVPKDVLSKKSHLPRNHLNRGISGPGAEEKFVSVLQYHLVNVMPACQPKKRSSKGLLNYDAFFS